MNLKLILAILLLFMLPLGILQAKAASTADTSPHKVEFVKVDKHIRLEVLDWGGTGRPLVFLAGLGNTAHIFDTFAPKFTDHYHVYGITRRGFGASSHPPPTVENYASDRLGDDVLAVITALKLNQPILVGHSIAGEELSSIGSRHPERVAGLIYLDSAYPYAFYDKNHGDLVIDSNDLRRTLEAGLWKPTIQEYRTLLRELIQNDLPQIKSDAQAMLGRVEGEPNSKAQQQTPEMLNADAITLGERRYSDIHRPILAIFALPHECKPNCAQSGVKATAAVDEVQADFVASSNPGARIVRLPNADHYIFRSNEAEVIREMNAFMSALPDR